MAYITRNLNQNIVYWGTPINDGSGTLSFSIPIQIKGRWEDFVEVITTKEGQELESKCRVYVDRKLEESGYILRGTIAEYSTVDPISVGAHKIIMFEEVPNLSNTASLARVRT